MGQTHVGSGSLGAVPALPNATAQANVSCHDTAVRALLAGSGNCWLNSQIAVSLAQSEQAQRFQTCLGTKQRSGFLHVRSEF